ncbi:IS3 family transposase [Alteribacillus bidgolensis]
MCRYIEFFYNRKRMHSFIGYMIPVQYAKQFTRYLLKFECLG